MPTHITRLITRRPITFPRHLIVNRHIINVPQRGTRHSTIRRPTTNIKHVNPRPIRHKHRPSRPHRPPRHSLQRQLIISNSTTYLTKQHHNFRIITSRPNPSTPTNVQSLPHLLNQTYPTRTTTKQRRQRHLRSVNLTNPIQTRSHRQPHIRIRIRPQPKPRLHRQRVIRHRAHVNVAA